MNTKYIVYLLQPDNVLIMCNGGSHLKLADFGFSSQPNQDSYCREPAGLFKMFCVYILHNQIRGALDTWAAYVNASYHH